MDNNFIPMDGFTSIDEEQPQETMETYNQMTPTNTGEKHIACVLLVDVSGSMGYGPMQNKPIQELNEALVQFGEVLKNDERASGCADVSIITFNQKVNIVMPFQPASDYVAPVLHAEGLTAMNEAIIAGLDVLEQRKEIYRQYGTPYYRPWMFLLTDGEATDTDFENNAKQRLQEAIAEKKVTFFPMGIGKSANIGQLKEYNNNGLVLKAEASHFKEAFVWLSSSMAMTTNSAPGAEKITTEPLPQGIEIAL